MKKTLKTTSKICLIVSAVICAALILLQLVPNWTYQNTETKSEETISILEYFAFTYDRPDVTNYFKSNIKQFNINDLASTFAITFFLGIASIILVVLKSDKLWISVFPFVVGCSSLIGLLTNPLWKLGNMYIISVILSAVLAICSMIAVVIWFVDIRNCFIDPKKLASK